jgi:hypothetical protein
VAIGKRSTNASFPIGLGLGARVGPTLDAPGESVEKMVPHGVLVHLLEMWAGPLYRTTMTVTAKVEYGARHGGEAVLRTATLVRLPPSLSRHTPFASVAPHALLENAVSRPTSSLKRHV